MKKKLCNVERLEMLDDILELLKIHKKDWELYDLEKELKIYQKFLKDTN